MSDDTGEDIPEIDNAADAVEIKKKQRRTRDKVKRAEQWWETVLNDEVGRRVMWGLLTDAHTFEERFACGPNGFPQPEATWFHAGEQSIGLRLYQRLLLLDPKAVAVMHEENDPRFLKKVR